MREKVYKLHYVQRFHGAVLVLQALYKFSALTCVLHLGTGFTVSKHNIIPSFKTFF